MQSHLFFALSKQDGKPKSGLCVCKLLALHFPLLLPLFLDLKMDISGDFLYVPSYPIHTSINFGLKKNEEHSLVSSSFTYRLVQSDNQTHLAPMSLPK